MKIQCDVCVNEAAVVLCTADEAALCQNCNNQVHNANKLARKHPRFSLVNPQFKEPLRCNICQERQAMLFCQEDRSLMCRECDIAIHRANEHTKEHNRFLLTGIKLSAAVASTSGSQSETKIKSSVAKEVNYQSNSNTDCSESSSNPLRDNGSSLPVGEQGSDSASSIPEYLMNTSLGWHVDDFLDRSSNYGLCKIDGKDRSFQMNPDAPRIFSSKDMPIYLTCLPAQIQITAKAGEMV